MSIKKLFLFLVVVIAITLAIFVKQVYKAINMNVTASTEPIISTELYNLPIDINEVPRGNPGAGITIVEYLDLDCSDCVVKFNTINAEIDKQPQEIRLFLKPAHTGGLFSNNTILADSAVYCSNLQKRFWPFVNALMTKENRTKENTLREAAAEARLNIDTWWQCTQKEDTKNTVNQSLEFAKSLNIKNSPTLFVNNKRLISDPKIDLSDVLRKIIPTK